METKNPVPPKVGDVFTGPPTQSNGKRGVYHVRAVVDYEGEDSDYGHIYHVVFRFWSRRKGWRYEVVSSHSIGVGLYRKKSRARKT